MLERTRPGTPVEKRLYALHVQSGEAVPTGREGALVGLDYGVRHTVSASDGRQFHRRDTGEYRDAARDLVARAKTRCRLGSRRDRKLRARARALYARASRIDTEESRRLACEVVRDARLLAREDLRLRNMTASGAGTTSAPGSSGKRGLNRVLTSQSLGALDRAIERRAVKQGVDTVCVHPGNTSITCNQCATKDKASRSGPDFACTACGHCEGNYNGG